MKSCSTCNPPDSHQARPIRNAYVPVPPASPVVSVSRKSHCDGSERRSLSEGGTLGVLGLTGSNSRSASGFRPQGSGEETTAARQDVRRNDFSRQRRPAAAPKHRTHPQGAPRSPLLQRAATLPGGAPRPATLAHRKCASLAEQPFQNRQRRILSALAALSGGAHARWAALLARTCGNQLASLPHQQIVNVKERFGEADSSGVSVIKIKVRFEKFLFLLPRTRPGKVCGGKFFPFIAHPGRRWALADGRAPHAAVAHQEQRRD